MIYAFDEADAELRLLPMASRRALDAAGLKLSLASYQTLGVDDRRTLVRLGAAQRVDAAAVQALVKRVAGAPPRAIDAVIEPEELPAALVAALAPHRALSPLAWRALSPLDRYVLDKLQRNGKTERLETAFDEITAREYEAVPVAPRGSGARAAVPAGCRVDSRSYPGEHGPLGIRVYSPEHGGGAGARAGLAFFHGGGFVAGDEASHDALCGALSVASDCVIASCAYPLAPAHRFPSALEDAYFGACFVHEHADEFGIDHRRFGVAGIEVGAGLATGVARLAKERRNPAIVLQLLIDPVVDLRPDAVSGITLGPHGSLDSAIGQYATSAEREDARCSPLVATNLIGLPGVIIASSLGGAIATQAARYAERLREVHVAVTLRQLPVDAFEDVEASDSGRGLLRELAGALREALG